MSTAVALALPEIATGTLPALIQRAAAQLASATTAAEVLEACAAATFAYDSAKAAARFARARQAYDEVLSVVYRAQADALSIEAEAKRRLADEYDAAQERGEVQRRGGDGTSKLEVPTTTDLGLSHKDIHEARLIRNAELTDPGIVRRTVDAIVERGEEPTRAEVRRAVTVHVTNNSGNNEWYTPAPFVEAARTVMGGIDCDPASSPLANTIVQAERFYTVDDDGLQQAEWGPRVWMNPPYGTGLIDRFAADLVRRYHQGQVCEACVLVNNATETTWFQTLLSAASAVCLVKGRGKFIDPTGKPSGAPLQGQAVLYLGAHTDVFASAFTTHGTVTLPVTESVRQPERQVRRQVAAKHGTKAPLDLRIVIRAWTQMIEKWTGQLDAVLPYLDYIEEDPGTATPFKAASRALIEKLQKFL